MSRRKLCSLITNLFSLKRLLWIIFDDIGRRNVGGVKAWIFFNTASSEKLSRCLNQALSEKLSSLILSSLLPTRVIFKWQMRERTRKTLQGNWKILGKIFKINMRRENSFSLNQHLRQTITHPALSTGIVRLFSLSAVFLKAILLFSKISTSTLHMIPNDMLP